MTEPKQLVSELLRPQQLGDLTLPRRIIDRLQGMIDRRSVMNMLFYGNAGLGKTSTAYVLINALGPDDSIEINGSSTTGIEFGKGAGGKICVLSRDVWWSQNLLH